MFRRIPPGWPETGRRLGTRPTAADSFGARVLWTTRIKSLSGRDALRLGTQGREQPIAILWV
jgi:hypothetical protein